METNILITYVDDLLILGSDPKYEINFSDQSLELIINPHTYSDWGERTMDSLNMHFIFKPNVIEVHQDIYVYF